MFKFSERSKERLNVNGGVHEKIIAILQRALEISKVDFGIPEHGGKRTAQEQNGLFLRELSKCDGYKIKSEHQSGLAVDVYAFVDGAASWEPDHLSMVACAILQASSEYGVACEWGGLWSTGQSRNGVEYGWDMAHFQFKIKG